MSASVLSGSIPLLRRIACLVSVAALASCAAPISFKQTVAKSPQGDYTAAPLSDALRELDAGKSATDPNTASGHYYEAAWLAGRKALAGEPGALALYNQSVGLLVESLAAANTHPWGRTITIGSGSTAHILRGKLEPGAPPVDRQFIPVANLTFRGTYSEIHATREGVGAPLVAISPENPDFRKTYAMPRVYAPLTAVLRFNGRSSATLELHNPLAVERISIAGRYPVLAADFSAPIAMGMAIYRPDKLGLRRLLNPQKYSDTARLVRIQEYDPHRIPVLFVHGLDSTPATWTKMYNSLMRDPVIRKNYQFWVFSYPSGYPYPYSASLLRRELDGIRKLYPQQKKMVIIGHSMGGMISRLMVTNAGDSMWRSIFGKSPAQTKITGASRDFLEEAVVFENRKEIDTAIFIASPHRGSEIASNWIGRLFSRLVHLPSFITDTRNVIASAITADNASITLDRAPNSIDTLSPQNRFVREVNKLPIAPGVTYHSIIGDRGKGDTPDSSDGVVPYWSSHMPGAASEKIVPSGHGAHENPEGIQEVDRILKEYLRKTN